MKRHLILSTVAAILIIAAVSVTGYYSAVTNANSLLSQLYEDKDFSFRYPSGWYVKTNSTIQLSSDINLTPKDARSFNAGDGIIQIIVKSTMRRTLEAELNAFWVNPVSFTNSRLFPDYATGLETYALQGLEISAQYKVKPQQVILNGKVFVIGVFDTKGNAAPNFIATFHTQKFFFVFLGHTSSANEAGFRKVFESILGSLEVK